MKELVIYPNFVGNGIDQANLKIPTDCKLVLVNIETKVVYDLLAYLGSSEGDDFMEASVDVDIVFLATRLTRENDKSVACSNYAERRTTLIGV